MFWRKTGPANFKLNNTNFCISCNCGKENINFVCRKNNQTLMVINYHLQKMLFLENWRAKLRNFLYKLGVFSLFFWDFGFQKSLPITQKVFGGVLSRNIKHVPSRFLSALSVGCYLWSFHYRFCQKQSTIFNWLYWVYLLNDSF